MDGIHEVTGSTPVSSSLRLHGLELRSSGYGYAWQASFFKGLILKEN
jgi:hypothetical protein